LLYNNPRTGRTNRPQQALTEEQVGESRTMKKIKGYTIELVEFLDHEFVPFPPRFGVFHSLLAARTTASLRMSLSAPRATRIGYRILDQDNRQVFAWSAGERTS
jgi:hypothetical protein